MSPTTTRVVLALALFLSGALAGENIDRALVAMPAWDGVGAVPWADFSRHADLGNGLVLYPIEAIGAALLTLIAAVGLQIDKRAPRKLPVPGYISVLLAAAGLVLTFKAAPIMLGIRDIRGPALLRRAFEESWYWGNHRAVCQVLSFWLCWPRCQCSTRRN